MSGFVVKGEKLTFAIVERDKVDFFMQNREFTILVACLSRLGCWKGHIS